MAKVSFFLIFALVIAARSVYAVQHIVGDSGGWTTFGDYTTWASSNTFNVGDTLCKFHNLFLSFGEIFYEKIIAQKQSKICSHIFF